MAENKLLLKEIYSTNKLYESDNQFQKQYNKIKEDNKDNDENNYVFVLFKGKTLKIEKKPRNKKKLNTALTHNQLSVSLSSKNNIDNKHIIDKEKKLTMTDRKNVIIQYKNLLKKLNFSPSQKLYNILNNNKNKNDRKKIGEEKKKKNKEIKESIYKKESLEKINKSNFIKGRKLKQIYLKEISNNIKEENKKSKSIKTTIEEYDKINIKTGKTIKNKIEENKKKSHSTYRSLSKERDRYKKLKLKNKIYEEEKNSLFLVNINKKLNKVLLEFNKENEKKKKEKNYTINSKSLFNYNFEEKNLLNRIRNLKKVSQKNFINNKNV